jgi:hypothetical protein
VVLVAITEEGSKDMKWGEVGWTRQLGLFDNLLECGRELLVGGGE